MQENLDTPFRDVDPETALQLVRDGFSDVLST
jgi:hypothetical protein